MERILIVDPNAIYAAELEEALKAAGYEVEIADHGNVPEVIREVRPDLIVVAPRSPFSLKDTLTSMHSAIKGLRHQPELLFLLRWASRGPEERLLADQWNVEVLYAG